jgi:NTP pyrophosphatase (non-canonical NTP hydrolase)
VSDETRLQSEVRELHDVVEALLADAGGCEWNRAQTHESLVTYLVEETAELVEAIEDGSSDDRREELGDVLYQVVLHAAIAARASDGAFDLADVVHDVREKTVRRHPHVFGAENASDVDDIVRLWSAAKAVEKASRQSAYDGVPLGLPALARAQKLEARRLAAGTSREGVTDADDPSGRDAGVDSSAAAPVGDEAGGAGGHLEAGGAGGGDGELEAGGDGGDGGDAELRWGRDLLEAVDRAGRAGVDAERALRRAVREREVRLRADEARGEGGAPP